MASILKTVADVFTFGSVSAAEAVGGAAVKGIDEATGAKAAREEQTRLADEGLARQKKLEADAAKRLKDEETLSAATEAQRVARVSRSGSSKSGRSGTILTSPLGAPASAGGYTGGKTLLGQ